MKMSESESHTISSSESDDSDGELDAIVNQNAQYNQLKSSRLEYGFENVKNTNTSDNGPLKLSLKRASSGGSVKQPKKTGKRRKVQKNVSSNGQSTSTRASTSTTNGTANGNSTNANANENDDVEADRGGKLWKHKKNSKTAFLQEYFVSAKDEEGNSGVECKICEEFVSVTQGNNSNMVSHLQYVSALFEIEFYLLILGDL